LGVCGGGAQLRVVTDSREYFPHSSGVVVAMDKIQEEFLGTPLFEIVFFKKGRETFSYEDFQKMRHYEQEIEDQFQKRYQKSYQLLSSNRFVQEANALYAGTFELPQFKESYFSLLSGVKPSIRALYPTQGVYRISLLGNTMSAGLYFEELKGLREILSTCSYEWSVNGLYYNLMYTQELLIRILAWSFLSSLGVISFLAFLFFRSIKIFFIFLLVNLIPLLLTLLFMYCFHLSINIATVMTFSIALGMIVDSTFHLTYIFQEKIPFEVYYQTTYIPILMSSFSFGSVFWAVWVPWISSDSTLWFNSFFYDCTRRSF
jgi:predicted RND superfamily exporter protein